MDRGAARSRKRAAKEAAPNEMSNAKAGPSRTSNSDGNPRKPGQPSTSKSQSAENNGITSARSSKLKRKRKERQDNENTDRARFQPKAIRTNTALIYNKEAFPIPPPMERLVNVTRLDLEGSGVTELPFLRGTGITWLSLKGCEIRNGWEEVGSLTELAVLNISDTGLNNLPQPLANLAKLKAIVAMNNPWITIDDQVVSGWKDLNSLIISHSPNLSSIPSSLSSLVHLSKLTFSHCPKLTATSLPDLSSLPLLRDVKMNNLPLLSTLPTSIHKWGTGDLSSIKGGSIEESSSKRSGEGLEVLDLGNCSLSYDSISTFLSNSTSKVNSKKPKSDSSPSWPNLRSLSLHSNPLGISNPSYAEELQLSTNLPKLQIIDMKRIVERKRKGELSETKEEKRRRERREAKMKPSGANVGGGKMRTWGNAEGEDINENRLKMRVPTQGKGGASDQITDTAQPSDLAGKREKDIKRKREIQQDDKSTSHSDGINSHKRSKKVTGSSESSASKKRIANFVEDKPRPAALSDHGPPAKDERKSKIDSEANTSAIKTSDPSVLAPAKQKPSKTETSVIGVIDVVSAPNGKDKPGKMKKSKKDKSSVDIVPGSASESVNLKEMFSKSGGESGSGLGVGGW